MSATERALCCSAVATPKSIPAFPKQSASEAALLESITPLAELPCRPMPVHQPFHQLQAQPLLKPAAAAKAVKELKAATEARAAQQAKAQQQAKAAEQRAAARLAEAERVKLAMQQQQQQQRRQQQQQQQQQ